jgi:uncharacterized membrane protein YbhN (UPF0104 family)
VGGLEAVPDDEAQPSPDVGARPSYRELHPRAIRIAKIVAGVFVLAVLSVELGFVVRYISSATDSLRHIHLGWLALALVAEAVSMAMFARLQQRMVIAGGVRIGVRRMISMTYAANAMSVTLPAGQVASSTYVFRKLRSWGAGGPLVTFTLVSSGVLSTITLAAILVIGATFSGDGSASPWLLAVEFAAALALALTLRQILRRPALLRRLGGWGLHVGQIVLRRGRAQLDQVIDELVLIHPRARDWSLGLIFATLNWGFDLACLVAACHAVGASGPSFTVALLTYAAGMTASSLPLLLPGGLGVVDGVLIVALIRGGMPVALATAGVLVYRLISLGLVSLVGWSLWLVIDRAGRREHAPVTTTT